MHEEERSGLALLEQFKWVMFVHPPYSPDLVPSDYNLCYNKDICKNSLNTFYTQPVLTFWKPYIYTHHMYMLVSTRSYEYDQHQMLAVYVSKQVGKLNKQDINRIKNT